MYLIRDCQLSMPFTNKTIQAALEEVYTEYGVQILKSEEDESIFCATYFDCDVKRLSCDLFRIVEHWLDEWSFMLPHHVNPLADVTLWNMDRNGTSNLTIKSLTV